MALNLLKRPYIAKFLTIAKFVYSEVNVFDRKSKHIEKKTIMNLLTL